MSEQDVTTSQADFRHLSAIIAERTLKYHTGRRNGSIKTSLSLSTMRLLSVCSTLLLGIAHAHEQLLERELPPAVAINPNDYTDCANAAWPPSDVGVELVPQAPDKELKALLDQFSSKNIEKNIKKLVSFGTRHTLSTQNDTQRGIGAARDWIASEMKKYAKESDGRMEVTVPGYIQGVANRIPFPVKISNVLATIKGSETPDRVYVMTGHYDSRVTDVLDYTSDAPGANDDASGTASAYTPSSGYEIILK